MINFSITEYTPFEHIFSRLLYIIMTKDEFYKLALERPVPGNESVYELKYMIMTMTFMDIPNNMMENGHLK